MRNGKIIGTIIITLSIAALFSLTGCTGKGFKSEPEKAYIFYPPLPNNPRYQYLTSFSSSSDVEKKKSGLFKFVAGSEVEKPRLIQKPYGVDIFEGIIYVCDIRSNAVITLDLNKNRFGYIGTGGPGKLTRPINVKVDGRERMMFVTDMGRNQVLAFDLDGRFIRAYGKKGEMNPGGIALDGSRIFVSDVKKNQIVVIDRDSGDILHTIGRSGHGEGELFHPSNICISGNRLYVSDMTNFRISIFDLKGNFIHSFGEAGVRPGTFARPKGIDVDRQGRIYVVDSSFENVQVFDDQYRLLLFMFERGVEKHNVNLPAVITLDYENLDHFRKFIAPGFKPEYLLLVTSNFGKGKVNVYAFGEYEKR